MTELSVGSVVSQLERECSEAALEYIRYPTRVSRLAYERAIIHLKEAELLTEPQSDPQTDEASEFVTGVDESTAEAPLMGASRERMIVAAAVGFVAASVATARAYGADLPGKELELPAIIASTYIGLSDQEVTSSLPIPTSGRPQLDPVALYPQITADPAGARRELLSPMDRAVTATVRYAVGQI